MHGSRKAHDPRLNHSSFMDIASVTPHLQKLPQSTALPPPSFCACAQGRVRGGPGRGLLAGRDEDQGAPRELRRRRVRARRGARGNSCFWPHGDRCCILCIPMLSHASAARKVKYSVGIGRSLPFQRSSDTHIDATRLASPCSRTGSRARWTRTRAARSRSAGRTRSSAPTGSRTSELASQKAAAKA